MFKASTKRLSELAGVHISQIAELQSIFEKPASIYIDYANVIHWHPILNWHISLKRLQQLHRSFNTIKSVKFYSGFFPEEEVLMEAKRKAKKDPLQDDDFTIIQQAEWLGYEIRKKPVKIMSLSIDVSGIPENVPSVLQNFIDKQLLAKLSLETIIYLNKQLKELNDRGIKYIEKRKCNFDVEIGTDMLLDLEHDPLIETYVLWSGDSDFAEPIKKLLEKGKKVVLFATVRRVRITAELENLKSDGLYIFDIKKIKEFICFTREMQKGSP